MSQESSERAERKEARDVASKFKALSSIELFGHLDEGERQALAQSARRTPFGRAEVITRQGAKANWLYVLVKGEVEVRVTATDGEAERRVSVLAAPSFFGVMALMTVQCFSKVPTSAKERMWNSNRKGTIPRLSTFPTSCGKTFQIGGSA